MKLPRVLGIFTYQIYVRATVSRFSKAINSAQELFIWNNIGLKGA